MNSKIFFDPAQYVVVIPNDIDLLIERWMRSSYYYFVDPKNKEYLYKDLYEDKAKEQGITMKQVLINEFEDQIENYKKYSTDKDVIITEINDVLKFDVYEEMCKKLGLIVNKVNYDKCKVLFSPSYEEMDPKYLAEMILKDNIPVRLQIQLHKFLWGDARGK